MLDNDAITYVIHELTVQRFVAKLRRPPTPDLEKTTLQHLIDDQQFLPALKKYVVVAGTCTVGGAKKEMAGAPSFQDLFVTQTGAPGAPVLGWITDTRLAVL